MNTNFTVIGLTRLGIKPESTASGADALSSGSSEQLLPILIVFVNLFHFRQGHLPFDVPDGHGQDRQASGSTERAKSGISNGLKFLISSQVTE